MLLTNVSRACHARPRFLAMLPEKTDVAGHAPLDQFISDPVVRLYIFSTVLNLVYWPKSNDVPSRLASVERQGNGPPAL